MTSTLHSGLLSHMNLSRYARSFIASGFGVAFLWAASLFGVATHAAPAGVTTSTGRGTLGILEFVYGCPAGVFAVAGTALFVFAALDALFDLRSVN